VKAAERRQPVKAAERRQPVRPAPDQSIAVRRQVPRTPGRPAGYRPIAAAARHWTNRPQVQALRTSDRRSRRSHPISGMTPIRSIRRIVLARRWSHISRCAATVAAIPACSLVGDGAHADGAISHAWLDAGSHRRRRVAGSRDLLHGVAPCYGGGRPVRRHSDHRAYTATPRYVASRHSPEAKTSLALQPDLREHETFGAVLTRCRRAAHRPECAGDRRSETSISDSNGEGGCAMALTPAAARTSGPVGATPEPQLTNATNGRVAPARPEIEPEVTGSPGIRGLRWWAILGLNQ